MELSRRQVLAFGGSLGLSSLSGCNGLPFVDPHLTLTLMNFDSRRHLVLVEILRAKGTERSESVVLTSEFDLHPPKEGKPAYEVNKPDLIESKKYLVRVKLTQKMSVREHYMFYPDCSGTGDGDEKPNEQLYIEIRGNQETDEPYIAFRQNGCGSDSLWY